MQEEIRSNADLCHVKIIIFLVKGADRVFPPRWLKSRSRSNFTSDVDLATCILQCICHLKKKMCLILWLCMPPGFTLPRANVGTSLEPTIQYFRSVSTMLAAKRSTGVAPEVNLRGSLGFKTQGRRHRKSKTGIWLAPQKRLQRPPIIFQFNVFTLTWNFRLLGI